MKPLHWNWYKRVRLVIFLTLTGLAASFFVLAPECSPCPPETECPPCISEAQILLLWIGMGLLVLVLLGEGLRLVTAELFQKRVDS